LSTLRTEWRFALWALAGIAVVGVLRVAFPVGSAVDWRHDLPEAVDSAAEQNKRVLIEFSAPWCAVCAQMEAEVLPADVVQNALAGYIPVKVDVDAQAELADRFQVQALPTYVVLDASGTPVRAAVGFQDAESFSRFLRRAAAGADD